MKWLDAFLEFKNEAEGTRRFALLAVIVITIGLASLSVTGIVATAHWSWMSAAPIIGMIIAVLGAEALTTVTFVRTLVAPTWKRKIVGFAIFAVLAAIGVHNAENGAHVVRPELYAKSSDQLQAEAGLAGQEAAQLGTAAQAAIAATPQELDRVRKEIADIQAEQELMSAQSPEGISKAQSLLSGQGKYFGHVDGIRKDKTESAMRARGEELATAYKKAKLREENLMAGQASPVQQGTTDKRKVQIETDAKANEAFWNWLWLIITLVGLESARSLSLWAFISSIEGKGADRSRERENELAEAEHAARLAAIKGQGKPAETVEPEPEAEPAAEPEPAPAATPEPIPEPIAARAEPEPDEDLLFADPPAAPEPELTAEQRRSRAGGLGAGHARRAGIAADNRLILIDETSELDAIPQLRAAE